MNESKSVAAYLQNTIERVLESENIEELLESIDQTISNRSANEIIDQSTEYVALENYQSLFTKDSSIPFSVILCFSFLSIFIISIPISIFEENQFLSFMSLFFKFWLIYFAYILLKTSIEYLNKFSGFKIKVISHHLHEEIINAFRVKTVTKNIILFGVLSYLLTPYPKQQSLEANYHFCTTGKLKVGWSLPYCDRSMLEEYKKTIR